MFSRLKIAALLLAVTHGSKTADDTFAGDYYACSKFTENFPNTCPRQTDWEKTTNFDDIPLADKVCQNIEGIKCVGIQQNNACVLKRQLCVQCYVFNENGKQKVRIRVQSNSVPNHCYQLEQHMYYDVRKIDFSVDWLPEMGQSNVLVDTQTRLNKQLCNKNAADDARIPSYVKYENHGDKLDDVWGISITGAIFATAVSDDSVDPFYPSAYGSYIKDVELLKKNVDWCLASTNGNRMFNYKVATSCIPQREQNEVKSLPMNKPMKEMILDSWKDYPFRTVIGIAKDGRPILSPYHSGG